MNEIIITVAGIQPPQPGKQKGKITDHTGKSWGAWPELLNSVVMGQTYRVNRFDENQYMGRTYYTLKDIVAIGNASPPPQGYSNRPVVNAGGNPNPSPIGRPTGMDDGQRRLDIFVCGAFNNIMANPNTNPSSLQMMDMVDMLHKLRSAWMGVFGPSPLPRQRRDDPISSGPIDTGDGGDYR